MRKLITGIRWVSEEGGCVRALKKIRGPAGQGRVRGIWQGAHGPVEAWSVAWCVCARLHRTKPRREIRDSKALGSASVTLRLVLLKSTHLQAGPHLLREAEAILLLLCPPPSPQHPLNSQGRGSCPAAPTNRVSHGQLCGGRV